MSAGLMSVAEEFAITVGAKVTMPSKSLLQGATYTPANDTDLAKKFERMRDEAINFNDDAACKVARIRRKA